jgi:hypothetical protein
MSEQIKNNLVELSETQLDEVAGGTYGCKPNYDYKKPEYKKEWGHGKKEYCQPKKEYYYDKKYGC